MLTSKTTHAVCRPITAMAGKTTGVPCSVPCIGTRAYHVSERVNGLRNCGRLGRFPLREAPLVLGAGVWSACVRYCSAAQPIMDADLEITEPRSAIAGHYRVHQQLVHAPTPAMPGTQVQFWRQQLLPTASPFRLKPQC